MNNFPENTNPFTFLFASDAHFTSRDHQIPLSNSSQNMFNPFPNVSSFGFQNTSLGSTIQSLSELSQQDSLLSRVFQRNIQAELLKAQMLTLNQLEPVNNHVNAAPMISNAPPVQEPQKVTESQVKQVLDYLLKNIGQASQIELETEKQKICVDNETLKTIFDNLVSKYASITKTKEEMVKYVFRKALKSIKDQIKGGSKRNDKQVNKMFFQKYFKNSKEELLKRENDIEEEDLLDILLPFKKNSTNKTLNSKFLAKIFTSKEFCAAFEEYLAEFESEADYDNRVKVKKFVSFIMSCVKGNKVADILDCKRVPWLKSWVLNAKRIGHQLTQEKEPTKKKKKYKTETIAQNYAETSDSECKAEANSSSESNS